MKAVVCSQIGPASELSWTEVDNPTPGPGQVILDVAAAGLNFPDTLIIEGKYQVRPELPFTPGFEAAGVVAELGEGVENVSVGDRVVAMGNNGAFAEKWVVDAAGLIAVPPQMDMDLAAGMSMIYGTSYHALKQRAQLAAGETLLVLGAAGGVGSAAIDIGKAFGATVVAAVSSPEKEEFCRQIGADQVINYSEGDLKTMIREVTGGRGADVIYDPVGGSYSEAALRSIAWAGRFLVVGFAAGDIPKIPLNLPLLKSCSIVGVYWGGWSARFPHLNLQNFSEIMDLINADKLHPQISARFPMAEFRPAFEMVSGRKALGKVILQNR